MGLQGGQGRPHHHREIWEAFGAPKARKLVCDTLPLSINIKGRRQNTLPSVAYFSEWTLVIKGLIAAVSIHQRTQTDAKCCQPLI